MIAIHPPRQVDPMDHQGMVRHLARKYLSWGGKIGLDLDDLIASGQFGLLRACELYDPRRGCEFSTYATRWIKATIRQALFDGQWPVRVPKYLRDALDRGETAETPGIDRRHGELLGAAAGALAARTLGDGQLAEGETLARLLADPRPGPDEPPDEVDLDRLRDALALLPPEQRDAVRKLYGLDGEPARTYGRLAQEWRVSIPRVRAVEGLALRRLWKLMRRPGI